VMEPPTTSATFSASITSSRFQPTSPQRMEPCPLLVEEKVPHWVVAPVARPQRQLVK
jgi:hypothetical protein